jgi:isoleucyl-tRNA synthetase
VLSIRKREKIKVRQPLQRIMIPVLDKEEREQVEAVSALIAAEVNVKEVTLLGDTSSILIKEIKPNFKTLGPRFGKDMKLVAQAIQNLNETQIQELEKQGSLTILINNKTCTLEASDVVISSKDVAGWMVASEQGVTVALDIQMNETLRLEGMARELVNRLQNMRKDLGFEVTDTIEVTLKESDELNAILNENKAYIQREILATTIYVAKEVNNEATELIFDSLNTQVTMVKS